MGAQLCCVQYLKCIAVVGIIEDCHHPSVVGRDDGRAGLANKKSVLRLHKLPCALADDGVVPLSY